MLTIEVGQRRAVKTIGEALGASPPDEALTLLLDAEVFHEKVFSERRALRLIGQGAEQTKILWQDGAFAVLEDGQKRGTFRSYTAFFDGDILEIQNMTIENAAGDGRTQGQAIAAAVHSRIVGFSGVTLRSMQDTLFLGPLPEKEREKNGFCGPRQGMPRIPSQQLYQGCRIEGDVDFVFGGADAVFSGCTLLARGDRKGFLAAPAQNKAIGFVFDRCTVEAETPDSLCLARAWRDDAKAAFLDCEMENALCTQHFDAWNAQQFDFCEYPSSRVKQSAGHDITPAQAQELRAQARHLENRVQKIIKTEFYEM